MAALVLNGRFVNYIYPATLMVVGVGANKYILGGQIKDLRVEMKDLRSKIMELNRDLKEEVDSLRGGFMAGRHGSVAAKIFEHCCKGK